MTKKTKKTPKASTKVDTKAQKRARATNALSHDKKDGGKADRRATRQPVAKENALAPAFDEWKSGATIHALATKHGVKRSKLRRQLIALAGGKAEFKKLREQGAGGTAEPFGGKRATGGRTREKIAIDDSRTFTLTRDEMKDAGWRSTMARTPLGTTALLIGPDGTHYAKAGATEKADLIYQHGVLGIPATRCKAVKQSTLVRLLGGAEDKEIERGKIALERTTARKRAARKARKTHA